MHTMHTCEEWMSKYGKLGLKITDKDICGLVGTAFTKICRMELAKSGFNVQEYIPSTGKFLRTGFPTSVKHKKSGRGRRYAYQLGSENEVNKKDENDTEETECIICGKSFEEDWVQCCKCCGWAHVGCADSDQIVYFVCENCNK
ncbi:hypothetical protein ANN_15268 [Periplaneta americana]|uniref:Uncharacterized protein n=1 Tax=Periplaneta americana TaxID=6978 RepID=A0ABQ8SH30_PERAM|nr:hypothetical protein ANN_15268 [Periplaneta americana]